MACTSTYCISYLSSRFKMIVALYTLIFMIIKFIMHYQQTTIPSLRRAALSNVRSNASLNHASWGENGWPIFFCWSGLFLLSQCMVLQVPQFNVAITLSFQPVICFWRNLWTDSCSLRTRPYQKYGKGSQGAVCEGIQWKVSDWWWLLFLHKSGKWGPPKLVSVELWEEDGRRAYMCTHIYIYIYICLNILHDLWDDGVIPLFPFVWSWCFTWHSAIYQL